MKRLSTLLFLLLSLHAMAAPPTVPSSNFSFFAIDGAFFNLGWVGGNGARRVMVAKVGSDPTFVPQNGTQYTASTEFGKGQEVAPGEFIVYDHFSFSYFLTGLTPATHYYFRLYEYNGTGAATEYLTSAFLSGNGWTSTTPTTQTSNATFSNITTNSVTASWTMGNGQRRLIVVREGAPVNADPVNNEPYSGASTAFGTGSTTGPGNYVVYRSSSDATSVTNLKAGTEYFFAFYEYNGNQQPQYLKPAYTASVTTRSAPTTGPTDFAISKVDGKELTLSWTKGNGQRRIVIAKQGSTVTSTPVDGTDYNANAVFGQGQQLATGEYVVYDNNFTSTTVSGLTPGTTYFFKIFEYDGTGSGTAYLTSAFAAVSGATATTPTVQTQVLATSNITNSSVRLNFTPGNGRARFVVGRSGSAVNVNPVEFTLYTENSSFGLGQDMGSGNFALATTNQQALTVQNLQPNTTYHFAIYELNGFNQPLYLAPAATVSATTTGTLPVTLISWEANVVDDKVSLQWKTAVEENASHFVVERSADRVHYTPVATVKAVGNSAVEQLYKATDHQPIRGQSFYRLKMVDKDASTRYSAIRTVNLESMPTVKVLSNRVQSNLQVLSSTNQRTGWLLLNAGGQVMGKGVLTQGRNEINVSALSPGQYWLQVSDAKKQTAIPFSKQ